MCKLPTESLKSPLSHQRDGRAGVESRAPASSGPRAEPQAGLAGSDLGFTADVPDNGYRWWYLDAFSPDHRFGLTIIAFIGSVFSPYYAAARRRGAAPAEQFCSLNAILYGPGSKHWAMTERSSKALTRGAEQLRIGPSSLHLEDNVLEFRIDDAGDERRILVHAYWHPAGVWGLLYWYALTPAHWMIFRGLTRAICQRAEAAAGR